MKWREVRLGEVVTLQRGYDLPERERRQGSIPVVSSSGISGYHDEARAQGPGVVTGRYGTFCRVYFIEDDYWPHNTTLFVKDFHGNDRRFVYYLLTGLNLVQRSAVSAVPGVNRNDLHRLEVVVPSVTIQRRIADILGALDDKIEVNHRINRTLEAMAQTLYKHWFVDFGPFQDGEFVESDVGLVPQGWSVATVDALMELAYGKGLPARKRIPGPYPVFGSSGQVGNHNKYLVRGPGIVVGRKGTIGRLSWAWDNFWPIDTTYFVVPRREVFSLEYLYHVLSSLELEKRNSDSAVPGLNRNDTYRLPVVLPPDEVLDHFDRVVGPWFRQIKVNRREMTVLADTRDYLLPKLLSGEIPVEAAEAIGA